MVSRRTGNLKAPGPVACDSARPIAAAQVAAGESAALAARGADEAVMVAAGSRPLRGASLPILPLAGWGALGLLSEYFLGVRTAHPLGADFAIYYDALRKASVGANPYLPYHIGSSFISHPFVLTLVALASWRSDQGVAFLVWSAASIAAWLAAVSIAWRLLDRVCACDARRSAQGRWGIPFVAFLSLMFAPFLETIHIGQINTFAVLSICLCLYLAEQGKDAASGFFLALAVVLKTSPAVLVLYFLALRRYRVAASALVSLTVLSLIAALQWSPPVLSDFLLMLPRLGSEVHPSPYNESILSLLSRVLARLGAGELNPRLPLLHKLTFLGAVSALLAPAVLAPRLRASLRLWLFAALVAVMVFFSPLVWYHHSVMLLLPVVASLACIHRPVRYVGGSLALLIQVQRVSEMAIAPAALPVICAQLGLILVATAMYLGTFRPGMLVHARWLPRCCGCSVGEGARP